MNMDNASRFHNLCVSSSVVKKVCVGIVVRTHTLFLTTTNEDNPHYGESELVLS